MIAGGEGEQPAPQPSGPSRWRALVGPAVAVGGVLLGIGSLLLVTDDPSQRVGPVVGAEQGQLTQLAPREVEEPPVDQPPVEEPPIGEPPMDPPPIDPLPVDPLPVDPPPPAPAPIPTSPSPAATGAMERQAPAPAASRRSLVVPITVLNNSRRAGLAERAAARFDRGGWPVARTGNFRGQIPVTTVYYDPGMEASARAFAGSFEGIVRVRPRFATLPARGVVVVLTRDFVA